MWALDKKVFEPFEVFSKWFVGLLLALHYIFPNKDGLMDRVEPF